MKHIYDARFKYVSAVDTDIRKRFEEVKKKLLAEKERSEQVIKEAEAVVAKTRIKGKT